MTTSSDNQTMNSQLSNSQCLAQPNNWLIRFGRFGRWRALGRAQLARSVAVKRLAR